ncbi:MAG TPA: hypothetical protein VMJ31_07090, partial [Methylocystis sp.]|nr:hypothetical protein [Methylocystis sp.]
GHAVPGGGFSEYFTLRINIPLELPAILSETASQPLHSRRFEATVALPPWRVDSISLCRIERSRGPLSGCLRRGAEGTAHGQ